MTYEYFSYDDIEYAQAHCDSRVCHKPGKCEYCDRYPKAQMSRIEKMVSFTGEPVEAGWRQCPAEHQRGMMSINGWGGNQPVGGDITDAEKEALRRAQRPSSYVMYGDVQAEPGTCNWCGEKEPNHHKQCWHNLDNYSESFLKKLSGQIMRWFGRS